MENRSGLDLTLNDYDEPTHESEMELTETSDSSINVIKVATAAIFAAVSLVITPVVSFIPRYAWGIAYFDPVSIFWIIAFLIGGIQVGLTCTIAGTIGLFLFDPTGIGPMFKFLATIPMIVVPWLGSQILGKEEGGEFLSQRNKYFSLMALAYFPRLLFMIPMNLILVPLFFPEYGFFEILIITILFNALQSLFDALIPFIVVYRTSVFEQFGMW
jgi:hypothetical protein